MTPKEVQDKKNILIANINSKMGSCPECRDKCLDIVHEICSELYNLQTKIKDLKI